MRPTYTWRPLRTCETEGCENEFRGFGRHCGPCKDARYPLGDEVHDVVRERETFGWVEAPKAKED